MNTLKKPELVLRALQHINDYGDKLMNTLHKKSLGTYEKIHLTSLKDIIDVLVINQYNCRLNSIASTRQRCEKYSIEMDATAVRVFNTIYNNSVKDAQRLAEKSQETLRAIAGKDITFPKINLLQFQIAEDDIE